MVPVATADLSRFCNLCVVVSMLYIALKVVSQRIKAIIDLDVRMIASPKKKKLN
jgi:hypothetical protein